MWWAPETPQQLLSQGEVDAARSSLARLRGCEEEDQRVLQEMNNLVTELEAQNSTDQLSLAKLLTESGHRQALIVILCLMFFQQFSGINAVIFYSQLIFHEAGSSWDEGNLSFLFIRN